MKFLLATFSFSIFIFTTSFSQTLHIKKLDSLFAVLQNHRLATGNVSISVNGKIEYQKAIGFALLDGSKIIAPDPTTKYRIGSVSKMFTAVLIFQLIEEEKLNLHEKLSTYFPKLPDANKITIKDMLYHRSGLPDYTRDTNFPEWMNQPRTQEEMLKIIVNKGMDFEPGAKAVYCNTNYLLLGYIIEKICKMPYAKALEKRITSKIKLRNTYHGKQINISRNEAGSYKYSDSAWHKEKETDLNIHGGAGCIVSTSTDLVVFIQQLFACQLITRASLDQMKTMIEGYGMGMFPYDFNGEKGFGHNGRVEEFYSAVRYYPEKKLAISYITNGILYPRNDILEGIVKICFNEDFEVPFSKVAVSQNNNPDKYTGVYASDDLPFKVTCKKINDKLIFEAAGRTMEAVLLNTDYYMNLKTGSFFKFNPEKGELQIKETDNIYYLKKEK